MRGDHLGSHLVHVRAEELLALELDVGQVVGLGAGDGDLAAQLDPGDGEDAAGEAAREGADVLLVLIDEEELALADVVHRDLGRETRTYIMLYLSTKSWEMKLRKEESILKLDKCWALFKNHLLVAQDLWGPKTTRNSVRGKAGS